MISVAVLTLAAVAISLAAAKSVLLGGVMGLLAMLIGPALHRLCRNVDPSLVLGLAVLSYFGIVGLLWVGYLLVRDESWLIGGFAGAGVAVATAGWAAGHMRAAMRLRQLLYRAGEPTAGR